MKEPIAQIIQRLMRELEDGSFEVAGYQKLEGGQIYVGVHQDLRNACPMISKRANPRLGAPRWIVNCWIPHDRIDRWTGVTLKDEAKTKVFERDLIDVEQWESGKGRIGFEDGAFVAIFDNTACYLTQSPKFKIIGIDGVHKTKEGGKHETNIQS